MSHSNSVSLIASTLPHFRRALSIGLYLSIDNEVDPSSLLLAAELSGKTIFLPVVDPEQNAMLFAQYRRSDPLKTGAFGIREPVIRPGVTHCSSITNIDLLFLPLVAFDRRGQRLGFGGGYYDRVLAHRKKKPLLIGLAYHFQETQMLPYASHDIPLHAVVTDRESRFFPLDKSG